MVDFSSFKFFEAKSLENNNLSKKLRTFFTRRFLSIPLREKPRLETLAAQWFPASTKKFGSRIFRFGSTASAYVN
jgi:hypothetical protein